MYRFLEDIATADIAFEVESNDLPTLFREAAEALFSTMADLKKVQPSQAVTMVLTASGIEELMFNWLTELIYRKDKKGMLFSTFVVQFEQTKVVRIYATVSGEPIDPFRHRLRVDVKAVTYHLFTVEKRKRGWYCRVVLDI